MSTYSCFQCKRPYDTTEPYKLLCDPCTVAEELRALRKAEEIMERGGFHLTPRLIAGARLAIYDRHFRR